MGVGSVGFFEVIEEVQSKPMTQRQSCVLSFLRGSQTTKRGSKRVPGKIVEAKRLIKTSSPTDKRTVTSPAL